MNPDLSSTGSPATGTGITSVLRRPPMLGVLIIIMMICEKMLAHTYTAITIYVLPSPWKWLVPAVVGCIGVWLVLRGMGRDEVKGSLLGYLGAVLIWMSWFESGLPLLAGSAQIPPAIPADGNVMAGLLGEHIFLQMSGIFCLVSLFFRDAEQGCALPHAAVDKAPDRPRGYPGQTHPGDTDPMSPGLPPSSTFLSPGLCTY